VGTTPKIALPAPGSTDGKDKVTGVKALLKVFKDTKSTTKNKTTAAAQKTGAATAPARATLRKAASAVSPANSGRWSFVWSMGAAWTLSFQTLIAVYDRAVSLIGAPQLMSGPQAMGWHLFEGPGHWFRDTLEYSWETGAAPRLFFLAAIGVLPIVVAQFAEKITSHTLRKIARLAGYGFPFIWACSHSYIDSFGFRTWDELYLSGLAASAWYFLTCSFGEDVTDFQKFIRRIPLASVVCGLIAYSPGAAF
jgi:hypothetical protein